MDIVPPDSRYVPIPQQPYCCVPANLSMVMLRRGLPLVPQELLGYHLGLVVPTKRKSEFWNPRHAEKPVVTSGFGTQIQNEQQFGLQKALDELNIPLRFTYVPASKIKDEADFKQRLTDIIEANQDVLLCLNWGVLINHSESNFGHVLAVDHLTHEEISLIDTDTGSKWKTFSVSKSFAAIVKHGDSNYGGLWIFEDHK